MNTMLISYDLRLPGRNYENLHEHLKSYSGYAKPLESLWLIETYLSSKEIRDRVRRYIDSSDGIFVVDITNDTMAWFGIPQKVSDWIKNL